MSSQITWSDLKRLEFANSPDLPKQVTFEISKKKKFGVEVCVRVYKEWVGIGWIDINPTDEAVEVIDG